MDAFIAGYGDAVVPVCLRQYAGYRETPCGTWSLNYSDGTGLVYLWLDLLRDDGEQIAVEYVVMKCPYDNGILLGIHEGQDGKRVLNGENQVSFWWGSVG